MKLITIPDGLLNIDNKDIEIDMFNLKFDAPAEKLKYYAFVFLRNIGSKYNLNFDKCSYDDKEEYLKLFLTFDIDIYSPLLASSWVEILNHDIDNNIYLDSILSKDEINKFIENNIDLVNKVRRLINSLSLYSVNRYGNELNNISNEGIETIDDTEVKVVNLWQLTKYDSFILIFKTTDELPPELTPGNYTIFYDKNNSYNMNRIMENLPFFNILSTLLAPKEMQQSFSENFINKIYDGCECKEG
jgi:hypothetical protein